MQRGSSSYYCQHGHWERLFRVLGPCLIHRNFETGAVVTRRTFTQLPWTDRLLAKVKVLAGKNIKKIVKGTDIKFLNHHGNVQLGLNQTDEVR